MVTQIHSFDETERAWKDPECKALMEAATTALVRNNAFRITGLAVDATTRDIHKHADRLRIIEELGQGECCHNSAFALRPPPTMDQIRQTIQRLSDPETRIIDEFFWFWPEEFGNSRADSAIHALLSGDCDTASKIWTSRESNPTSGTTAMHNVAVVWHLTALERAHYTEGTEIVPSQQGILDETWRQAMKRWHHLMQDDVLWEKLSARIRQIDDPRLPTGFSRRMRHALPLALAKMHGELALSYIDQGRLDLAKMHVHLLRDFVKSAEVMRIAVDLVLASAKGRLQESTLRVRNEARQSPEKADQLAGSLIAPTLFLVEVVEIFFDGTDYVGWEQLNETVSVCTDCAILFQRKTGKNEVFVDLLRRLQPLSTDEALGKRIAEAISIGKKNIEISLQEKQAQQKQAASATGSMKTVEVSPIKKSSWLTRLKNKFFNKTTHKL